MKSIRKRNNRPWAASRELGGYPSFPTDICDVKDHILCAYINSVVLLNCDVCLKIDINYIQLQI